MRASNTGVSGAGGITFDCDGTLVDSAPIFAKAWGAGFATSGHVMAEDWYRSCNGLSEHVLMEAFDKETGMLLDRTLVVDTVRDTFLSEIAALQGLKAIAALARLAAPILPVAVASGGPAAIVLPSLSQTGLLGILASVVTSMT
jgi:beta-phosphoglucomutase-like phosphatase (HAD superfamily)